MAAAARRHQHTRTDSPREPIDAPTAAVDRLPTLRRAARGQLARTGSFLLAAMSSCWRISLALVLSLVLLALTEMGGLFWVTQRNHSSLQIQAARLAHIPL